MNCLVYDCDIYWIFWNYSTFSIFFHVFTVFAFTVFIVTLLTEFTWFIFGSFWYLKKYDLLPHIKRCKCKYYLLKLISILCYLFQPSSFSHWHSSVKGCPIVFDHFVFIWSVKCCLDCPISTSARDLTISSKDIFITTKGFQLHKRNIHIVIA